MTAVSILLSGLIVFAVGALWMFRGTPGIKKAADEKREYLFERLGLFLLLAGAGLLLWALEALANHG